MTTEKSLKEKAIKVQGGKEYVLVADRVIYFNEKYPDGCIQTEIARWEGDTIAVKATAYPEGLAGRFFTGLAQEVIGEGPVNKTSALENAETSAVGRCLAFMGIGVIDSIASADEIHKANNRATEKPWYNDFKKHVLILEREVREGATPQEILERIESKYRVNREIKDQILSLGKGFDYEAIGNSSNS
jgi:hypothetical protein